MINKLFTNDIYIKVIENRFEAKNLSANGSWESIIPDQPFTTERLLVGNFSAAETALKSLLKSISGNGIIKKSAKVVIHPMTKVEGGLCEVEERIFKELSFGAGAYKVALHVGPELSDSEALQLIKSS